MLTAYPPSCRATNFPSAANGPAAANDPAIKPFWIDLLDPTPDEVAYVNSTWGLQVPSRADLDEIETSSRLRCEGQILYLSMPLGLHVPSSGEAAPPPAGFVLSSDVLVTVRFVKMLSVARVAARFEKDDRIRTSANAFVTIMEEMVDIGADTLEKLSADLAGISRDTFQAEARNVVRTTRLNRLLRGTLITLGAKGELLSQFRDSLLGLRRIVDYTGDTAREWLPQDIRVRLKTVRKDLDSLTDFESHLSIKVQFLLDAVLGFINTEQNDMFKVLTIASVVGIPPTLIASMYGMNFHNMPELAWRWGYVYGLALIALSTIVPIVWFKRRGWW